MFYKGYWIERAGSNASGIRYITLTPNGNLRADTLKGIKALISEIKG
jgi:hypothetical protein